MWHCHSFPYAFTLHCIALHTFNSFSPRRFILSRVVPSFLGAVWCHLMKLNCFMTLKVFPVLSPHAVSSYDILPSPGIHSMHHLRWHHWKITAPGLSANDFLSHTIRRLFPYEFSYCWRLSPLLTTSRKLRVVREQKQMYDYCFP